jgi:hypothetical protein
VDKMPCANLIKEEKFGRTDGKGVQILGDKKICDYSNLFFVMPSACLGVRTYSNGVHRIRMVTNGRWAFIGITPIITQTLFPLVYTTTGTYGEDTDKNVYTNGHFKYNSFQMGDAIEMTIDCPCSRFSRIMYIETHYFVLEIQCT